MNNEPLRVPERCHYKSLPCIWWVVISYSETPQSLGIPNYFNLVFQCRCRALEQECTGRGRTDRLDLQTCDYTQLRPCMLRALALCIVYGTENGGKLEPPPCPFQQEDDMLAGNFHGLFVQDFDGTVTADPLP